LNRRIQAEKARGFLALHHDPKLLVLPNIWDPLGARLLEDLGYPAVATASAAVAWSRAHDDGERLPFPRVLEVIARIANAVDVPVSADIEGGYARSPDAVGENVRRVLRAGAIGINLEDGVPGGKGLHPLTFQCERIRAARIAGEEEEIPLVINARIDVFLQDDERSRVEKLEETVTRARAYLRAGADCIYPIPVGDLETLSAIREQTDAPVNVFASASTAPLRELEEAGMSRLSLGPGFLKASLTTMKRIAEELAESGSYDLFTTDTISSDEVKRLATER
jgi:2-methylisocitrate lyase-like PEP mutase family enzyme